MSSYDPFIQVVTEMMRNFGGNGTLTIVTQGEYDPDTSEVAITSTDYPVRGLMFDYIPKADGQSRDKNSLIQSGDKQFFLKPDATIPAPTMGTDKVTYGSITYSVAVVKEMNPSGAKVVYYELYLRE